MWSNLPLKQRVAAMLGVALLVALGGLGVGGFAVCRALDYRQQWQALTEVSRNQQEKIDRQNGQAIRLRQSFDSLLAQLQSRDDLLTRAGEVQRQLALRQTELAREQERRQALWQSVKNQLDHQLGNGNGLVVLAGNALLIHLSDRLLFGPGQSSLSHDGAAVLKQIAGLLNTTLRDCAVQVEGHTDDLPIVKALQYKYPTNWELSAARASSAVVFLINQGQVAPDRLAAVGRGDTGPLADNATEAGRAANRRIDIVVLLNQEPAAALGGGR
ncbi:MAG: OmpA family protein [Verrucomicrobiales bacterium]|jgi:chemotaxis protein MotB|nr:OmpA family protein [Verrucomicrobiales bacterium]